LSNCVCGVIDFGFASTIPRSTSCFSTPRSSKPTLSPACPSSNSLRNISTPVTTTFLSVPNPTISTSSFTFTFPRSIRPVPHVPLHQVQQLRFVHQVALVQEHDNRRHVHLPRQQNVLPRLRHRPVDGRDDQDRPVHLRRPRDHVLHVVGVPRAVHVRVVPVRRGVLHVRRRNRQDLRRIPPPLRFRRLRHLVVRHVGREPFVRRHLRQRRRQRRLPVVHVPNGPHVH